MLIRLIIDNYKSIGEELEFNMLPMQYKKTFPHHVHEGKHIRVLKTAALYGANGAGKSNVFDALNYLQELVVGEHNVPKSTTHITYRLNAEKRSEPIRFEVEFTYSGFALAYGLEMSNGQILSEYLYELGFKDDDILIFERKLIDEEISISLNDKKYFKLKGDRGFVEILKEHFLENDTPLLRHANLFKKPIIQAAYDWFSKSLFIITPDSKFAPLVEALNDSHFNTFANNILNSLNTGIEKVEVELIPIEEYGGDPAIINEVKTLLESNPDQRAIIDESGVTAAMVNGLVTVMKPYSYHVDDNGEPVQFEINEESDGSRRIIDYMPLFQILMSDATVIVDEFERSIHPSLLKAVVKKILAPESNLQGQLIFLTHDCNLLDQSIFRQDEIWFVEKNQGKTTMYPLTDFDVRPEIDINKGYLKGRFGAIPFLGNLENLKWTY